MTELVAIWPDGIWCLMSETRDFEDLLQHKSDDYRVVLVEEWEDDGTPHRSYFE